MDDVTDVIDGDTAAWDADIVLQWSGGGRRSTW